MDARKQPLVASQRCSDQTASDALELITAAVDKYVATESYERAAQAIKEGCDRRLGPTWHVFVGEGYGYEMSALQHISVYYGKLCVVIFQS